MKRRRRLAKRERTNRVEFAMPVEAARVKSALEQQPTLVMNLILTFLMPRDVAK